MANISLYVSGQTELNDVTEFFQKRLIGEGETPIAFFDGVFYEAHQERVGNIVFQDYLVYTDKAVYLWARGTSKDFLDRFSLGAVSVNSRNKDSAFATLNLKIKREGKEPVFVIFDMVEIREAEMIVKLHTVIESTVEDYLGVDFRHEIPQDIANKILQGAQNICPPRTISIALDNPQMPLPDAGIGYGQDLLEQYKASVGYSHQEPPQPGAHPRQRSAVPIPEMPRGLEGILPTDPAAIKRIAGQLKDMVGDAPLKFRDQLMKDLQHVPNDVATVLTAVNELLANIAGNPQAERFVMNAIKTAVEHDGIIGSVGKIIKLTGIGGQKKPSRPAASPEREERSTRSQRSSARMDESEDDSGIRRRKISVRDDDDQAGAFDPFRDDDEAPSTVRDHAQAPSSRRPVVEDDGSDAAPRRKKLSIRAEGEGDDDIARKLMSYDEADREEDSVSTVSPVASMPVVDEDDSDAAPLRKKLSIRIDRDEDNDIARKLMSYDEADREEQPAEIRPEPIAIPEPESEPEAPARKKIQIKSPVSEEAFLISENEVLAALGGAESGDSYMTLESDIPLQAPVSTAPKSVSVENAEPARVKPENGGKEGNAGQASDTHSVSVKPTP